MKNPDPYKYFLIQEAQKVTNPDPEHFCLLSHCTLAIYFMGWHGMQWTTNQKKPWSFIMCEIVLLYFVGVEMMPVLQEVYNEGSSQAQYPHIEDALRAES